MNKSRTAVILVLSLIVPLCLFIYNAYNSYGYDDEFWNVDHILKYDSGATLEFAKDLIQGNFHDTHPQGSYMINYILLQILGSWSLIRVAGAFIVCIALWLYWYCIVIKPDSDLLTKIFSYIFICLNPTVLLWCTSVRWYVYFSTLVCAIASFFKKPLKNKYLFWGIYFALTVIMFYLESTAAIYILISFILFLFQRRKFFKDEYKTILLFGVIAVALVARQAFNFLTVVYPNAKAGEVYSLIQAIVGGGQNFLCNQALVPIAIPGIILIAANLILFCSFIMNLREIMRDTTNQFFVLTYAGIIFSGIGGKIRNFVNLSSVQGNFMTDVFSRIKSKILRLVIIALYCIGTFCGIYNVINHTDTTKASYNTPYPEILDFIASSNPEKIYPVISHNPVLNYHAQLRGFKVYDVYQNSSASYDELSSYHGRVIAIRTYKGSMSDESFKKYNEYISGLKIISETGLGYDKFAGFKRKFAPLYPDYYATILIAE